MGLMDFLFPRKSTADDVLSRMFSQEPPPPQVPRQDDPGSAPAPVGPIQNLELPRADVSPAPVQNAPLQRAETPNPVATGEPATATPGGQSPVMGGPIDTSPPLQMSQGSSPVPGPPDPTPTNSEPGTLEAPLRDLFTEGSALDPQFEALLERVEKVDARDLATELRDLARSIGADSVRRQA